MMLAAMAGAPFMLGNRTSDTLEDEEALEPELPIIDCHHHLRPHENYTLANFTRDVKRGGHRVERSIFVECGIEYRTAGPAELRSLGEAEYVAGLPQDIAAMVGRVDMTLGTRLQEVLERHIEASGGRLRGIRNNIAWDSWPPLSALGPRPDLLSDPAFREGMTILASLGLSFDIWLFHPQIGALADLARRFPNIMVILNHLGSPLGIGPYAGKFEEVFGQWRSSMSDLARLPNVAVKLGGLGPFSEIASGPANSRQLAERWRPYVETAIALFGVERCMFESNWPSNASMGSYGAHWNAFKRITADYSAVEKTMLYQGTARHIYRLN